MTPARSPHHEIFEAFQPFHGEAPAGYDRDFIGSKIRREFWGAAPRDHAVAVTAAYPPVDEEYFEWIDLLESVAGARGSYTMVELGAGYGRWAVRAALAVQQYSGIPFHLIAVEAEPFHFGWMRVHFEDNGIDPGGHRLVHAAISGHPGSVPLYIDAPWGRDRPDEWYGQHVVKGGAAFEGVEKALYAGFEVQRLSNGGRSIKVPGSTLTNLLENVRLVDLIDFDLQGEELDAVSVAIHVLDAKVRRMHIGTHSWDYMPDVEGGLRELLGGHGWRCLADYPAHRSSSTPWGSVHFEDGVQSWVNPRLDGLF